MDINVLTKDKKSGRITFLLKGATPAFANSLRRAMIESVPTMAIDSVEFSKNNNYFHECYISTNSYFWIFGFGCSYSSNSCCW